MRAWIGLGLLAWAGCKGGGAVPPDEAAALVERLGHEDPAVRDGAEAALAAKGTGVEGVLLAAMDAPEPEQADRARRLYRRLAAGKLELILDPPSEMLGDPDLYVWCSVRNGSRIPVVLVGVHFFYRTRVAWSRTAADGTALGWMAELWRHGCSDVHPFEEKDFVVVPPGETRKVGWFSVNRRLLPPGRHRLLAKYAFRRPEEPLDPRYLPTARLRRLYEAALEVDGVVASFDVAAD